MNRLHFIVIGKNDSIVRTLVRVISAKEDWTAFGCRETSELYQHLQEVPTAIILLSSGLDAATENEIMIEAVRITPTVKVIVHYGGGSGLLYNEVQMALSEKL